MQKKLLFLDTETTGNEEKDYLCEIAYICGDIKKEAMFKPQVPITVGSMAVHHITNKMVKDRGPFIGSPEYNEIKNLLADESNIFVAHNAMFDIKMIKKEGLDVKKYICTLRVARHLDPEEKIESYRLQYLRYLLEIEVDGTAHDALGDVLVLEQLFARLQKKIMETDNISADEAIEKMIEISSTPSLIKSFKFGKHNGKTVAEVAKIDAGYLDWLLKQKMENEGDEEDWIYTLRHYLGKLPI